MVSIMEISITRALAELKLLDSRITRGINSTNFVTANKKSAKNVSGIVTKDEFFAITKANYQSVISLIERKKMLKSAIVFSNAKTLVTIGGKEMTVAEAIERKNNIEYEKDLLNEMVSQRRRAIVEMENKNSIVDANLDKLLETMLGKDGVKNADKENNSLAITYRADNEYEILDPLGIDKEIKDLQEEIERFESEVDYVLSESNTVTKITIED